jgi:hypothetical protein
MVLISTLYQYSLFNPKKLDKRTGGIYASKPLERRILSLWYLNAMTENMHVIGVLKALTKVLHKCFCRIYASRQPKNCNYGNNEAGICTEKGLLSPPL